MPYPLPPRSAWWFDFVRDRIAASYLRKHCHAVRISRASIPWPSDGTPILVAMNHPSWWDPLLAFVLSRQLAGYAHYGVIDARMLAKYPILAKAGIFGIDLDSRRGAAAFLRNGRAVLERPRHALWVTAQGTFVDVRTRPLGLRPGVGHLASAMATGWVVPVALEMGFWNERAPEALVRVGAALPVGGIAKEQSQRIESALTATLDGLAEDSRSRDPARFETIIQGRTGIGGVYDFWRRLKSAVRGKRFDPSHGGAP
ncbi:MAG: lysophospholipid acyltransferase family protein [Gemmataceae bacterium]|nr:lysophospholipid acyltransferase family protein [Gemmataceae bacterium]